MLQCPCNKQKYAIFFFCTRGKLKEGRKPEAIYVYGQIPKLHAQPLWLAAGKLCSRRKMWRFPRTERALFGAAPKLISKPGELLPLGEPWGPDGDSGRDDVVEQSLGDR